MEPNSPYTTRPAGIAHALQLCDTAALLPLVGATPRVHRDAVTSATATAIKAIGQEAPWAFNAATATEEAVRALTDDPAELARVAAEAARAARIFNHLATTARAALKARQSIEATA